MGERIHVGKMLDISDEDAAAVIRDIAVSISSHPSMSAVVGELAAKYGERAILAGMMMAKAFEENERAACDARMMAQRRSMGMTEEVVSGGTAAAGEKSFTLQELLGITDEESERLLEDFKRMLEASKDSRELCKLIVDKHGVEAVYASMCLRMALECGSQKMGGLADRMRSQCPSRN